MCFTEFMRSLLSECWAAIEGIYKALTWVVINNLSFLLFKELQNAKGPLNLHISKHARVFEICNFYSQIFTHLVNKLNTFTLWDVFLWSKSLITFFYFFFHFFFNFQFSLFLKFRSTLNALSLFFTCLYYWEVREEEREN